MSINLALSQLLGLVGVMPLASVGRMGRLPNNINSRSVTGQARFFFNNIEIGGATGKQKAPALSKEIRLMYHLAGIKP